jgi:hypothetical protein
MIVPLVTGHFSPRDLQSKERVTFHASDQAEFAPIVVLPSGSLTNPHFLGMDVSEPNQFRFESPAVRTAHG